MNPSMKPARVAGSFLAAVKKTFILCVVLGLLGAFGPARAEGPDTDYLVVYAVIDQADALNQKGKTSAAHAKYLEAQRALAEFQKNNSGWNNQMVAYRQKYLAEKISATSSKGTTDSSSSAASVKTSAAAKSPVKLLTAGSEPRKVLRLHPASGDKQTLAMSIKMAMTMSAGGETMPAMDLPTMVMTMEVTVKDASTNGEISYTILYSEADTEMGKSAKSAASAAMKSSMAGLRGLSGEGKISDRGIVKSLEMKLPPDADPQLSQSMSQMKESFASSSTPLPEEAVGPGAKWEYKSRIKSQGMTVDQTMTFELLTMDGDQVTLRTALAQNAAGQKVENPSMPGMKMDLTKLTVTGNGKSTIDLGQLMPSDATLDENSDVQMSMNVGQQKQAMSMKMSMKVKFEGK